MDNNSKRTSVNVTILRQLRIPKQYDEKYSEIEQKHITQRRTLTSLPCDNDSVKENLITDANFKNEKLGKRSDLYRSRNNTFITTLKLSKVTLEINTRLTIGQLDCAPVELKGKIIPPQLTLLKHLIHTIHETDLQI